MPKNKGKPISTRPTVEQIEELEKIAERDDLYISDVIRSAIDKYLEGHNDTQSKSKP